MKYITLASKRRIIELIQDSYSAGFRDAYDEAHPEVGMPAPPRGCVKELAEFTKLWDTVLEDLKEG